MNGEVRRIGLAQYLQVTPLKTIGTWATFMVNSKIELPGDDATLAMILSLRVYRHDVTTPSI